MLVEHTPPMSAPATARGMAEAARRFLESLDPPRLAAAHFAFADHERYRWNYRPDGFDWEGRTFWHEGLRLVNMTPAQQQAAFGLLDAGLSAHGLARTRAIMALEHDLRETERHTTFVPHVVRDPELYAFALFGEPGGKASWAWRAGGHHLGLHFTVVDAELAAATPLFFGAMAADQRELLVKLLRVYVDRAADEVAAARWRRIEQAGLDPITFAWVGGAEPGQPHYYAIKGPTFLVEYDKTQDGANHIHSVLRDFTNDWGEDVLAAHYAQAHRATSSG